MAEALKKSDIEVLVATMNRNSLDFLQAMFPFGYANFSILVVNQTAPQNIIQSGAPSVRVLNVFETGLSKSRNTALANSKGKFCIIADDDVIFNSGFDTAIINAFNINPDAALIGFRTEKAPGKLFKKYPSERKTSLTPFDYFNVMSVEMVLNREIVTEAGMRFDERFGLGAQFCMGEEAIFVNELQDRKLKVVMEPEVLTTHAADSTHTKMPLKEKYYTLGAVYTAIFGSRYLLWLLIKIIFDVKHAVLSPFGVPAAIKAGLKGRRAFKEQL